MAESPAVQAIDRAKWKLFAIVSVLSLIADQITKIWSRAALPVGPDGCQGTLDVVEAIAARRCVGMPVTVIENYWDWRLAMNPGSAFGLFSTTGTFGRVMLSVVGVLAVAGMIWMLRKARPDQRVLHWALAFVAGGAVGNLIDRMYFGVVTDFVLWRYKTKEWPVFNIADVVLVVGVGLMFIDIQKEGKREKALKKERQAKAKQQGLVKDLEKR
ncbi:MAG: signal peptidase II [Deltaproteobacteria bacterium]|nr:signal peptidase II [Deltaproteobacteria bacterium]MDQ3298811.1 signal peptidase II [Myxococcota bacterium]